MASEGQYRDDRTLTSWTLGLLWARVLVASIAVVSGYFERDLLMDMQSGEFESEAALMSAAASSDSRERIIGATQLILFIICGTTILVWIYRACHNVRVKAPQLDVTPAASVGWYFIPIANYWMPYVAMRDIWEATAEQAGKPGDSDRGLLRAWWILFIVRSLLGAGALAYVTRAESIEQLLSANAVTAWINVSTIALCVVFIVMVNRLRALQAIAFSASAEVMPPAASTPSEPGQAS